MHFSKTFLCWNLDKIGGKNYNVPNNKHRKSLFSNFYSCFFWVAPMCVWKFSPELSSPYATTLTDLPIWAILQKASIFEWKKFFLKVIFSVFFFFFFEIHYWGVPEAKNALQPNSYSKWRGAKCFEISMTRLMEFHWSGTWKINYIDGISLIWYLKS